MLLNDRVCDFHGQVVIDRRFVATLAMFLEKGLNERPRSVSEVLRRGIEILVEQLVQQELVEFVEFSQDAASVLQQIVPGAIHRGRQPQKNIAMNLHMDQGFMPRATELPRANLSREQAIAIIENAQAVEARRQELERLAFGGADEPIDPTRLPTREERERDLQELQERQARIQAEQEEAIKRHGIGPRHQRILKEQEKAKEKELCK